MAAASDTGTGPSAPIGLSRVARGARLRPSPIQRRLWFLAQLGDEDSAAYNLSFGFLLDGPLDRAALRRALDAVYRRHEVLRSCFPEHDGEPALVIAEPASGFPLEEIDWSTAPDAGERFDRLIAADADRPFDLVHGPVVRATLVIFGAERHGLLLNQHHIVSDGTSQSLLWTEICRNYDDERAGRRADDAAPALSFVDYSEWLADATTGPAADALAEHWRRALHGAPPCIELPFDRPRGEPRSRRGGFVPGSFDAATRAAVRRLADRHGVSLFVAMMASWVALLFRLSGQNDLVLSFSSSQRDHPAAADLLGFFINTLPFRLQPTPEMTVSGLLTAVHAAVQDARAHRQLPFDRIVEAVRPPRGRGHDPISQHTLNWLRRPERVVGPGGVVLRLLPPIAAKLERSPDSPMDGNGFAASFFIETVPGIRAKFELTPTFWDDGERIVGGVGYACDLFDHATIARWVGHWRCLLPAMCDDDPPPIGGLPLLSAAERRRVLHEWNRTTVEIPRDRGVHALFDRQVERTPDAVAVIQADRQLDYRGLQAAAERLAATLVRHGVGPGRAVAILIDRSIALVVAELAVLKCGAFYLPLDPSMPPRRLRQLVDDSAAVCLLVVSPEVPEELHPIARIEVGHAFDENATSVSVSVPVEGSAAAYVMYTSGSTGAPKGVVVPHRGITRLCIGSGFAEFRAGDRMALASNPGFDISTLEVWAPLLTGGSIVVIEREVLLDLDALADAIVRCRIDTLFLTAGMFKHCADQIAPALEGLRCLMVGGDVMDPAAVAKLDRRRGPARLLNGYGPTEATTFATTHEVAPELRSGAIPIGLPIGNTTVYLLDAQLEPVPIGVVGEIVIGGDGVALGYLGRPEATAAAFVADPFDPEPGRRMYRSGDYGRRRADGVIEFLGRRDFQIKHRGYRIEAGEIEARLAAHPAVHSAVVMMRGDESGSRQLVAYYVRRRNDVPDAIAHVDTLDADRLAAFVRAELPEPMVPAAYVALDAWPLNPNGKIDRAALPAPGRGERRSAAYVAPEGPLETAVAVIWAGLVGVERVGRGDDFFALGGHSLMAIQAVSRVRQQLGRDARVGLLFAHPVLADFVARLPAEGERTEQRILPEPRDAAPPLSFAQQRLWFLAELGQIVSEAYHIPLGVRLTGDLDRAALRRALARIVDRHESLRTSFGRVDGVPFQRIAPAGAPFPLREFDLAGDPDPGPRLARLQRDEAERPFDLATGPLIRGLLVRHAEHDFTLVITQHHILSDGWSVGVFIDELSALYRAFRQSEPDPLPPLPIQYADFAIWQRRWLGGALLERQAAYWREHLAGAPEVLDLPTDRPRPVRQDYLGGYLPCTLDPALSAAVTALAERHRSTLFMTLLAAWAVLMARLSGQDDLVIGSATANRTRPELERLIGFFVNALALRVRLAPGLPVAALLAQVRQVALAAQEHQDIPFEQVVELLRPQRSLGHNPLFQVAFAWQSAPAGRMRLPGVELAPLAAPPHVTAKFDLSLFLWQDGATIVGGIEYASALFDRATIERWLSHWKVLLAAMCADDAADVFRLPLLTPAERNDLILRWNQTRGSAPLSESLAERVARLARERPASPAVVDGPFRASYAALDAAAAATAARLADAGVRPGATVLLAYERGAELVVAMLACRRHGAVSVPVDPAAPVERLRYVAADCGAVLVLGAAERVAKVDWHALPTLAVDPAATIVPLPPPEPVDADAVATILYTSGSTGRPKGVRLAERGIRRLVIDNGYLDFGADDRVAFASNPAFDASTMEVWGALANGATLVVIAAADLLDPERFQAGLAAQRISILLQPSGLFSQIARIVPEAYRGLRCLLVGGDVLEPSAAARVLAAGRPGRLLNAYGPTEITTIASTEVVEDAHAQPSGIPIGRPIRDTRIYLLDAHGEPVPIGVRGELVLAGAGVALGYVGLPELEAERFALDPFGGDGRERMYRSGDLGRRLADGRIEFLGRGDDQVKIRGYRVELAEVEAAIAEFEAVAEAAVVVRGTAAAERALVAYVAFVTEASEELDALVEREQVDHWRGIYDSVYASSEVEDERPDFTGWNSSYTQQPIPEVEMREWQERTLERLIALRPRRILEIGCGSGLLLLRLAPHCESYRGVDFSGETIRRLARRAARLGLANVTLEQREARDLGGIADAAFDLVVINSVVQYFPNAAYLDEVLAALPRVLAPDGRVFVGDVRNLDLIDAFHGSTQIARSAAGESGERLRERIRHAIDGDKELLLSPGYFRDRVAASPDYRHLAVLPKHGRHANELTKYRYDALLSKCAPASAAVPAVELAAPLPTLAELGERLARAPAECILLSGLPCPEIVDDLVATRRILDPDAATPPTGRVDFGPEALVELARHLGRRIELSLLGGTAPGTYAALLLPVGATVDGPLAWPVFADAAARPLANTPGAPRGADARLEQLRSWLAGRLPDYMLPARIVVLERLPLTANGKVDKAALPLPGELRTSRDYEPPATPTERLLAEIWAGALDLARVGRRDDFFALGGHSLLAVQVSARLRSRIGIAVDIQDVFAHPVLADLAAVIAGRSGGDLPELTAVPRQPLMPLSPSQERLWFLAQLEQRARDAYRMPLGFRIRGALDPTRLAAAFAALSARHEVLRTTIATVDDVVGQRIAEVGTAAVTLDLHDLRDRPDPAAAAALLADALLGAPIDLAAGPLTRAALIRVADAEHHLLLVQHHIISDGVSQAILLRDLAAAYAGTGLAGGDPRLDFSDVVAWQRRRLTAERLAALGEFWAHALAGAPAVLDLPSDRARPAEQDFVGDFIEFELDAGLVHRVDALAQRHGATLFMALLSSWIALLSRLSGATDLVVGTPTAQRLHPATESIAGFFVNSVAIRVALAADTTVHGLLANVRSAVLAALRNQELPFERVVELVRPERTLSYNPVFQHLFGLHSAAPGGFTLADCTVEPLSGLARSHAIFDTAVTIVAERERLRARVEFATALFDRATIDRWIGHWQQLLAAMTDGDHLDLRRLPLIDAAERARLLAWSRPATVTVDPRSLPERFAEWVRRTPDALALTQGERRMSYAELDRRSSRLAAELRRHGIGDGEQVPILVGRDLAMVVGLLAVMKAGAAYVPLDPEFPAERLRYILREIAPRVGLVVAGTDAVWLGLAAPGEAAVARIVLDLDEREPATPEPVAAPPGVTPPSRLAYVIYTSGSTGQPKGVMVEHRGLGNLYEAARDRLRLGPGSRVLQCCSFTFDVSVLELLAALCSGASLHLAARDAVLVGDALEEIVERQRITHALMTPTALATVRDAGRFATVEALVVAGDAVPATLARHWAGRLRLLNGYGPTEATVVVTLHGCAPDDEPRPPIGRPLPNTRLYLLDPLGQPVPVGVAGELYIGGVGVARGYLGRPELTSRSFLPDPFGTSPEDRVYRSGDLARWRPDGTIDFLGRADGQVKIRGFRIETGEIEARLVELPWIAEAAVLVDAAHGDDRRLVAYYTAAADAPTGSVAAVDARRHLAAVLPTYMVPAAFIRVDAMPLTASGKLDRRRLGALGELAFAQSDYEAPEGDLEGTIAEVFEALLALPRVGRHDNFFALGGHSLLVLRAVAVLRQEGLRVEVADLFRHADVASLAARVAARADAGAEAGAPLITLRDGAGTPLFFAHDGSGLLLYAHLVAARLATRTPVHGLAALPLDQPTPSSVAEIAARFVPAIEAVAPQGPLRLAGWSFGGVLAYEIAVQLGRRGRRVERLCLIDAANLQAMVDPVRARRDERSHLIALMRNEAMGVPALEDAIARLQEDDGGDVASLLQRCLDLRHRLLPAHLRDLPAPEIEQRIHRQVALHSALIDYAPRPIDLDVVLLRADEAHGDEVRGERLGWEQVLPPERLTVVGLPGNHFSMMKGANLDALVAALDRHLADDDGAAA